MTQEFTDQNVKEIIASGRPVVVDCWATWCTACVRMAPELDRLAETYADAAVIGKYNVEDETDIPEEYAVRALPTILFFRDGKLAARLAGSQTFDSLQEKLKTIL
jgi:thioredoxin 1